MTTSISVVIPVYNAEKYLRQCLDSILAQSFTDFEVLLMDDGSTDQSDAICDEYALKDARFRVFHNDNMGSAAARQFGFERVAGKYVTAVDSDDWVDTDYLANMYALMDDRQADLVMCAYWRDEDTYMSNQPTGLIAKNWRLDMLSGRCHAGLWNKLLKTDLLLPKDVLVPKCDYYEDMVVTLSYLHQCGRVVYSPEASYHYRSNPVSLTNDANISKRICLYEDCMENLKSVSEKYCYFSDSEMRNALYSCVNREKIRLLDYFRQYDKIRPHLLKYFPESPSVIHASDMRVWGVKNALRGRLFPYIVFKVYNWTRKQIRKKLCPGNS